MTDDQERPTVNQPLHGEHRPIGKGVIVAVIGIAIILGVFALIQLLRYTT